VNTNPNPKSKLKIVVAKVKIEEIEADESPSPRDNAPEEFLSKTHKTRQYAKLKEQEREKA
jgi:hypothetical protein